MLTPLKEKEKKEKNSHDELSTTEKGMLIVCVIYSNCFSISSQGYEYSISSLMPDYISISTAFWKFSFVLSVVNREGPLW